MKKLLNNAVEELMVKVNVELNNMEKDINISMSVNAKLRVVRHRKANVTSLIKRLEQMKQHTEKIFPNDKELIKRIDDFIFKTDLALTDKTYKAYGCY